ncbi:MAG: response regulator [Syntrophaceae bacterium]|nr:response regulator [Syntrophaceae bacterium]
MTTSILVVDDHITALENLEAHLQDVGYQVYTASDGEEGLIKCRRYNPDVVIMDIFMPGLRGDIAAKAIQADPQTKDTPIIFLTALLTKKDVPSFTKIKGSYYIAKPYKIDELLLLLNRILPKNKRIF